MAKKLILLAMAVAAFAAMAIPATASAEFTLKDHDPEGIPQKVNPKNWVVGTSIDTVTTDTVFGDPLECPHIRVAAEVQVNSGKEVTAANASVGTPTNCKVGEEELTITEPALEHLVTNGEHKGVAELSFVADVGPFECPYGGAVPFTYGTGTGEDTLTLLGPVGSPFEFCEGEKTATFEGTYTLTTTDGSEVWIEEGP